MFLCLSRAEVLLTCTLLQTIIDSKAPRRAESNLPDTNILTPIKILKLQGPQLPGMLSKLSGLFSSLQGTIAPGMLGVGGFSGQPAAPDQAAGSALPTQDPNASALAGAGQGDGPEAGPNPNWRPFSDMMQVIESQRQILRSAKS